MPAAATYYYYYFEGQDDEFNFNLVLLIEPDT